MRHWLHKQPLKLTLSSRNFEGFSSCTEVVYVGCTAVSLVSVSPFISLFNLVDKVPGPLLKLSSLHNLMSLKVTVFLVVHVHKPCSLVSECLTLLAEVFFLAVSSKILLEAVFSCSCSLNYLLTQKNVTQFIFGFWSHFSW